MNLTTDAVCDRTQGKMIRFTLHPDKNPEAFKFLKDLIVIGEGSAGTVDISFPGEGLHQNHVRILQKGEGYLVVNQANDPFVTLNGIPFGKKPLSEGDLLEIRNHPIRIDRISFDPADCDPAKDEKESDLYPDIEALANEDNPEAWYPHDLITEPQQTAKKEPQELRPHPIHPMIEEAYEIDNEPPRQSKETKKAVIAPTPPKRRWKLRLLKATALIALLATAGTLLMGAELYLRARNQSESEEMAAAESLADYAMALTYARIYQSSIQKQNWIDPQFIRNNLVDLLSSTSIPCGEIDAQGAFCNCDYFLRFYTSRDFSRFILVAQPTPTISQWLFPKKAVLVDSDQMKLKELEDLRVLNRLLSSTTPLDGEQAEDVTKFMSTLPVLKLTDLAKATGKTELIPPASLKYINPGAENLIYNAPRYHHLSGTFLKKAQTIIAQPYGTHVAALLQQDIDALVKLPNLVYYVDSNMHEAEKTRKILRKLSIPLPFYTAYLIHDRQGQIQNSRLVFDSGQQTSSHETELAEQPYFKAKTVRKPVEELDPVTRFIREKAEEAHQTLTPLLNSLSALLLDASERDSIYISPLFDQLFNQYKAELHQIGQALHTQVKANAQTEKLLRETGLWDLYQAMEEKETAELPTPQERWQAFDRILKKIPVQR